MRWFPAWVRNELAAGPSPPIACEKPLSSPEILHKISPMVKTTGSEKVEILSEQVEYFYVNQK